MRAAGNILATSNQENVDIFIFRKGLDALSKLLATALADQYPSGVMKELCWALSNVTAGSAENIESFAGHPQLLEQTFTCMKSTKMEVRREATYVITNAIATSENLNLWAHLA